MEMLGVFTFCLAVKYVAQDKRLRERNLLWNRICCIRQTAQAKEPSVEQTCICPLRRKTGEGTTLKLDHKEPKFE